MPKQRYCAKATFDSPSYSQGVKVSGSGTFLFISGQISQDAKGRVVGRGDFLGPGPTGPQEPQGDGRGRRRHLADVVKLTFFLTDVRYRQDLVPIREEFFGPKLPASTLITTPALAHPDYLIEIEAVAFVEGRH